MVAYTTTSIDPLRHAWFYEPITREDSLLKTYLYGDEELRGSFSTFISERLLGLHGFEPSYPGGAKYVVVLTHDVDNIYPSLGLIKYYLRRNLFTAIRLFAGRIRGNMRVFLNLERILAMEKGLGGGSSTFFLLVSDRDVLPFYRSYASDPMVVGEIRRIDGPAEIGLHTGYHSYNDPVLIRREKLLVEKILKHKIHGVRNHYLNIEIPETWILQEKTGFLYDSTIGFKTGFGYRNGVCHPYIPYDTRGRRWIGIFELPITIMDRGLIKAGIDPGLFFEKYRKFIDKASKYGCYITLLWHNDLLFDPRFKRYSELYWEIIEYAGKTEGYLTNALKAVEIWSENLSRAG